MKLRVASCSSANGYDLSEGKRTPGVCSSPKGRDLWSEWFIRYQYKCKVKFNLREALFHYKLEIFTTSVLEFNVQFKKKRLKEMPFLKVHGFLQVFNLFIAIFTCRSLSVIRSAIKSLAGFFFTFTIKVT